MVVAPKDRTAAFDAGNCSRINIVQKSCRLWLAVSEQDVQTALRLRFLVFDLVKMKGKPLPENLI